MEFTEIPEIDQKFAIGGTQVGEFFLRGVVLGKGFGKKGKGFVLRRRDRRVGVFENSWF